MSTQSRKHRGYRTQKVVAEWFAARGWPHAESTGAARQGVDITGMVDVAVEVKARREFSPLAWVRQARTAATGGAFPLVIFRCNGQGETDPGEWLLPHPARRPDRPAARRRVRGRPAPPRAPDEFKFRPGETRRLT